MPTDALTFLRRAPSPGWAPCVVVLAAGETTQSLAARACRCFEPYAQVHPCARLADAFRKIVSEAPDLLIVDPGLCDDQLLALLHHARRFQPSLTIVLAAAVVAPSAALPARPRADACLEWRELTQWLAQMLPRLRCRAQLAALTRGAQGDTTLPTDLMPAA